MDEIDTSNTVSFTPVVVTAETLQALAKQENYPNLLALYMAYVEVTTWQQDNSIKATSDFMAKRLKWRKDKVSKLKKPLLALGLIKDVRRTDKDGRVTGHFILVKHIIKPEGRFEERVANGATSANDLQLSANDLQLSSNTGVVPQPSQTARVSENAGSTRGTPLKREKKNPSLLTEQDPQLTKQSAGESGNRRVAAAASPVAKAAYDAARQLKLPISNHNNFRRAITDMEKTIGLEEALNFIEYLTHGWLEVSGDYKPELLEGRHIWTKYQQIRAFQDRNTPTKRSIF